MASKHLRNRAAASRRRAPATPTRRAATVDGIAPPLAPAAPPPPVQPTIVQPPAPDPDPAPPPRDAHGFEPAAYDWVPVPRARRVDGWTVERQRAFIGHLAATGSVQRAARDSGMSASSAYRLRQSSEGRGFAAAWESAIQQAAHALVDAAFERAVHGSEEPVFDREGRVIGRRFRQSDAMMMFLLRKHFPDRYGDLHRDRPAPSATATAPLPPPVDEALARLGPVPPPGLDAPSDATLGAPPDHRAVPAREQDEAAAYDPVREHMERAARAAAPAADPDDPEFDDFWGLVDDPEEMDDLEEIDDDDLDGGDDDGDDLDDDFDDDDFEGSDDASDGAEDPDGGDASQADIP